MKITEKIKNIVSGIFKPQTKPIKSKKGQLDHSKEKQEAIKSGWKEKKRK